MDWIYLAQKMGQCRREEAGELHLRGARKPVVLLEEVSLRRVKLYEVNQNLVTSKGETMGRGFTAYDRTYFLYQRWKGYFIVKF
jgi:hypothetical protein